MDAGPAKARRRFTAAVRPLTVTYRMDDDEFAAFSVFVDATLAGGALEFLIPDPWATGGTFTVRLTSAYEWRGVAGLDSHRDVSLALEIMP